MEDASTLAPKIVTAFLHDLRDRKGLEEAWESIERDIRLHIIGEWQRLVTEILEDGIKTATDYVLASDLNNVIADLATAENAITMLAQRIEAVEREQEQARLMRPKFNFSSDAHDRTGGVTIPRQTPPPRPDNAPPVINAVEAAEELTDVEADAACVAANQAILALRNIGKSFRDVTPVERHVGVGYIEGTSMDRDGSRFDGEAPPRSLDRRRGLDNDPQG